MARLHILSGAQEGEVIELTEERMTVGHAPSNIVRLEDDSVSACHAMLTRDGDDYLLRDLNSTNGTYVNQARVVEIKLNDGDHVQFGVVQTCFELAPVGEPLQPIQDATEAAPASTPESVSVSDGEPARRTGVLPWVVIGLCAVSVLVWFGAARLRETGAARANAGKSATPVSNVGTTVSAVAQMPREARCSHPVSRL